MQHRKAKGCEVLCNTPLFLNTETLQNVKKLAQFFGLSLFFVSAFAQHTRQPISNFTPAEYGQGYSSYTHAVTEDENGLIYVGTAFGILQFDGTSWRFIPVKSGVHVTSLAFFNNTVYVGSQGEFGFLKANENGRLEYQSLSENLSEEDKRFTEIWKVLIWNKRIVFQAEEKIFVYANDSISVINPETSFFLAYVVDDQLFVRSKNVGLMAYGEGGFSLVPNGQIFADIRVFAILPYKEDSKVIVTEEGGIWVWESSYFYKINTEKAVDSKLDNSEIIGGKMLSDGNYALYSMKGGVLILDKSFGIITEYNENTGMLSSDVKDIIEDEYGNLWAATQMGASRILYTSPFSYYNQSSGLYGTVLAVGSMGNQLLVGTSVGLFIERPVGMKVFEEVEVTKGSGSIWAMEKSPQGLWIATDKGLWLYDGKRFTGINHKNSSSIRYIRELNWIISAGYGGLQIIDTKTLRQLKSIEEVGGDIYGIAYKFDKKTRSAEIWLGSKTSGIFQLIISPALKYNLDFFGPEDGLPSDWVCAYQAGNDAVFATSEGMLRFVYPEEIYSLMGDNSMSIEDIRGYFDIVDLPKYSHDKSITAFLFGNEDSYAALDYHVHSISMSDSIPNSYDYVTLQMGRINTIAKQDNELYVGGDLGLCIVNQNKLIKTYYAKPHILLRKVTIGQDSIIWHGDVQIGGKQFIIPFSLNTLSLDIASTYHDNGIGAQYSWMIKDVDKGYTRWTPLGNIALSNLREGEYELLMVAKNIHDEQGNEIKFNFRILPPWYRSVWAYILYAIISIALIILIIQINIRRLKAQNRRLEEIVRQRTKEVVEQKERIENILEDIRSSINYAQRIQQALLPSRELIREYLPKHFIIFKPRDVVSGDFYWAARIKHWIVVTVVDCTGHGVPGAFMSMLGMSFLHEIVRKEEVVNAAHVLIELRKAVIEALKQTGKQNEQKDGMDMSLAVINLESKKCCWAGANNPLYIVRSNGNGMDKEQLEDEGRNKFFFFENCYMQEIKADKMPVAIHTFMDDYTNHEIELHEGDRIYLFTDGFADQFGGPDYRKFMAKSLRALIADTFNAPIAQQGSQMEQVLNEWITSAGDRAEQIDDITLMGIEI